LVARSAAWSTPRGEGACLDAQPRTARQAHRPHPGARDQAGPALDGSRRKLARVFRPMPTRPLKTFQAKFSRLRNSAQRVAQDWRNPKWLISPSSLKNCRL
jgi:hypothetical protein